MKSRTGSTSGVDSPERSAATLKWDYSGIRLVSLGKEFKESKDILSSNAGTDENCQNELINNLVSSDTKMLQLIYGTVRELQTETRAESRRARMATKQLQATVRKVVKSCLEIEEKLNTMETITSVVEVEVEVLKEQVGTQRGQLTDIMWKLEDYENRQRRNNLRFLGIEEGVEGNDIRVFMIKLLRNAFPELTKWDLEAEIQRVHRFPLARRMGEHNSRLKHPRAILGFCGNYLLRQAIYEKAHPDAPRCTDNITFLTLLDYCHVTVERRWRLQQLIKPFQERGEGRLFCWLQCS
ncbi:hypothetical protein NDU88_004731 [Pleurodeles waltl]|uniref:Uncharacterized protein n=1 Tax=Pleurodeles waltl TaxID=8319 RepID=A0AAV7SJP3_PLEWA|nr:hypothetical protein NDU88_004731 [Pleurodeles waltl]